MSNISDDGLDSTKLLVLIDPVRVRSRRKFYSRRINSAKIFFLRRVSSIDLRVSSLRCILKVILLFHSLESFHT